MPGVLANQVKSSLRPLNSGLSVVEPSRSGGTQPAAGFNFGPNKGFIDRVGGIGGLMGFGNPIIGGGGNAAGGGITPGLQQGAQGAQGGATLQDIESLMNILKAGAQQQQGDGGTALAAALSSQNAAPAAAEADPFAQSRALSSQLLALQNGAGGAQPQQQGLGQPLPQEVKVADQQPQNAFQGSEDALALSGLIDFISRIAGGGG